MPELENKYNIPQLTISLKEKKRKQKSFHLSARELHDECSAFISVEIICFEHLQQGSYEKLNPGIFFSRVRTTKCTASCNHDCCLEDNYCVPFFKLKLFISTLRHIFCSPIPSNSYGESDFVKSVSRNKLGKYTILWFKKRDFYF